MKEQLREPLSTGGAALSDPQLDKVVADIFSFRNTPPRSGLLSSFDQLSGVPGVTQPGDSGVEAAVYSFSVHLAGN